MGDNFSALFVAALPLFVVIAVVEVVNFVRFDYSAAFESSFDQNSDGGGVFIGDFIGDYFDDVVSALPISLVFGVVYVFLAAALYRGAIQVTLGRKPTLATMFTTERLGRVMVAGVALTVATNVGFVLCVLPGLILYCFAQFTYLFILDAGLPVIDAIKASFRLVRNNLGASILVLFGVGIAFVAGMLACLIGIAVTVPVGILAQTYVYRRVQNQPVAP